MGARDIYIYELYKDGKLIDSGLAKDLAKKYFTCQNNVYTCWRDNQRFLKQYEVKRKKRF